MTVAEIVTIGTELLLGEIQDTNSKYIARLLRDIGVDLYRLTTIGDNVQRITATLQEALMRSDVVITTGGLGPTVDDPTRQAVANVFNVPLVYDEELWQQILQRFSRYKRVPTENNKRQAFIPADARPISNPVGTAPAFAYELGIKTIISLPGVPREMEYLMDNYVINYLKQRYKLHEEIIKPWVIHTVSLGESSIDEIIGEMESYSNPTVGLLAHPGQTDVRVTAKASSEAEAEAMMRPVVEEIRAKLGKYIYGENEATIEGAVAALLLDQNIHLGIIEIGTQGEIGRKVSSLAPDLVSAQIMEVNLTTDTLLTLMQEMKSAQNAKLVLGVRLVGNNDRQDLWLGLLDDTTVKQGERSYGGPPGDGSLWAFNSALDYVRRYLLKDKETYASL